MELVDRKQQIPPWRYAPRRNDNVGCLLSVHSTFRHLSFRRASGSLTGICRAKQSCGVIQILGEKRRTIPLHATRTHCDVMRITHKMLCGGVILTLEILLLILITMHFCTVSAAVIYAVLDTARDSGDECASHKNFQPEDFHMTKKIVLVCRTGPAF